jgi:hypothetical protein
MKSIEKYNNLVGNQSYDLPDCSILPQPTTLPRALSESIPYIPIAKEIYISLELIAIILFTIFFDMRQILMLG